MSKIVGEQHPEEREWWMMKLMVFWITPLIKLASVRQLNENDVWDCPKNRTIEVDVRIIREAWSNEKAINKCKPYYNILC
jgi:hypothetical protein